LNRKGRDDLIICDRFGCGEKWKNLVGVQFEEFVNCDDLFEALHSAKWSKKIDAVIHMGARTDTTERDIDFLMRNNFDYSRRLCEWSVERKARFIYASSAAVYGDGSLGFSDDDALTPRLKPLNGYGFSKWLFDMWVLRHGLSNRVAGVRFFNVFGPNEYHKGKMASVVFRSFPSAAEEGRVRLFKSHRDDYADGEQARDFIYIDQAVSAVLFLLDNPDVNGIFNVGTGRAHTFNELATAIFEALDKPAHIEYFDMPEEIRNQYQYHTQAEMSKLYGAGFPQFEDSFAENVKRYVREYLAPGLKRYCEVSRG